MSNFRFKQASILVLTTAGVGTVVFGVVFHMPLRVFTFLFVLNLANAGLPILWHHKHRENISSTMDAVHLLKKTLNRRTLGRVLLAALLLSLVGSLLISTFHVSGFTCSVIVMLGFIGALYYIFLVSAQPSVRVRPVSEDGEC